MQTLAEQFLSRAIEYEKRAAQYRDGAVRFNLLKLAEYYGSLAKRAGAKPRAA